jgi:hypothetical protein
MVTGGLLLCVPAILLQIPALPRGVRVLLLVAAWVIFYYLHCGQLPVGRYLH